MRVGIREILFFAVLLAVPVAAYYFVFAPRNVEINRARGEMAEKRLRLDELTRIPSTIDDLDRAIRDGQEAIDLIEAKLPGEKNVEEVLSQVWQIARRHRLNISSVQPEKKIPSADYMELPIKVQLSGNFDGFYEFLLDLERFPRLTRMKDLSMRRIGETEGDMTADFLLSIFFEPERQVADDFAGAMP